MPKIRVLIVDDAVVVRRMVSDVLSSDPALEVAGTAPNGRIAMAKISHLNPDLVTLDVEMPVMDGLETLAAIRKTHPTLPVIMFSTVTERGASATLDALALGAKDYVTKPANVGSVGVAMQRIRDELIPKIKVFCSKGRHIGIAAKPAASPFRSPQKAKTTRPQRIDIVSIGVSTGGPNALTELLSQLPVTFPVPIVIVQHMPPLFTKSLAERLSTLSEIGVREGARGEFLRGGCAWIAPGGYHMDLVREVATTQIHVHQNPPENSCRPAVDVLFRSVAKIYGRRALAVVLTGMGQDGLRGCECIREAGGQILIQDEPSSVVWGMPAGLLVKYFQRVGSKWQISEQIRWRIQFSQINLTHLWPPLAAMDIIFMRNVLIYFDVGTKRHILDKACQVLKPKGYLVLGGAETALNLHESFERVQFDKTICYRLLY